MTGLNIPMPRMPTPAEHRAASLAWLSRVQPTLIDQWPEGIAALSMPTKLVAVPDGLYMEFCSLHDGKAPGPVMEAFADQLDREMGWTRKFIRLNSRSPKDWLWPFESPITCSGKEALSFMACSERVLEDLMEFQYVPEQPAYVCLRDVIYGLDKSREYRCFVKDGELIAVTHYDYTKPIAAPADGGKELRGYIDAWFAEKLKPVLHIPTVVFDLFQMSHGRFLLIEINPYGLSDPCFFQSYSNVESAASFVQFDEVAA
jgi:hypothetical protein